MKRSNVSAAAFVEYYRKIEDGECVWYYVERLTDNVINPVFSAYVNRVLEQTKDADPETMHAQFAEWFDYAEKKAGISEEGR